MFLTIKLCTQMKPNYLKSDYLHKMDLAINNLQRLICHKTQPTNQPMENKSSKYCILMTVFSKQL